MRRVEQITLKQLRTLQAVVETGTIVAAADRLNLTAPAIHSQLKLLEDHAGSALLIRDGKNRNQPTPQGEALLHAYAEAQAALDRAMHRIEALDRGQTGSVVLGVVSTAKYFAPRIVALLQKAHPDIEVVLQVGNRDAIIAALDKRQLDLCIMGRPPREPLVEAEPLGPNPHIIVAAADNPLAGASQISLDDLLSQRFILREEGSGTRILATRFLDEIGGGREVRMIDMSSNETIKQAVMSGLGIAILSAHTVAEELRSGRLVSLAVRGMPIVRTWFIMWRIDQHPVAAAATVRDWIVAHPDRLFPEITL